MKRQEHNKYILHDNYAECFCYNLKHELTGSFIIDIDDVEKCKQHRWYVRHGGQNYYSVATDINNKRTHLHRYLLNYDGENEVDHIDRNPMNNRKENLRIVSRIENVANNSGECIQQHPNGKFKCLFIRYGQTFYLGYFNTKEDALKAKTNKLIEIENNKEHYIQKYKELTKDKSIGVSRVPSGKWNANIVYKGKTKKIGLFDTPQEAKEARDNYIKNLIKQRGE